MTRQAKPKATVAACMEAVLAYLRVATGEGSKGPCPRDFLEDMLSPALAKHLTLALAQLVRDGVAEVVEPTGNGQIAWRLVPMPKEAGPAMADALVHAIAGGELRRVDVDAPAERTVEVCAAEMGLTVREYCSVDPADYPSEEDPADAMIDREIALLRPPPPSAAPCDWLRVNDPHDPVHRATIRAAVDAGRVRFCSAHAGRLGVAASVGVEVCCGR